MNSDTWVEALGYASSALIILSITQTSILRLRLLGLAGSFTFLVYSLAIGAYPIAVVNVVAAGIHIWYLRKLIRHKDEVFRVLHVLPSSRYLLDFLDFYDDEIRNGLHHDFVYAPTDEQIAAFILRDMVPAGLLIGHRVDDGTFRVDLDFVIPQYRDFKIGGYVFSPDSELFTETPPTCVWTDASNPDHARYLRRMGFIEHADTPGRFEIRTPVVVG
ncbi:MAG: YgjV family protein [Acidimicrobiia bacterium]|nr:YgjV family protein [Acidimicrobiia bacterium]